VNALPHFIQQAHEVRIISVLSLENFPIKVHDFEQDTAVVLDMGENRRMDIVLSKCAAEVEHDGHGVDGTSSLHSFVSDSCRIPERQQINQSNVFFMKPFTHQQMSHKVLYRNPV
jgi:hypothetical protein